MDRVELGVIIATTTREADMSTAQKVTTAEELLEMPDNGCRYELLRGELREMSPTTWDHGDVLLSIGARLRAYVRDHGLGGVAAGDTGFIVSRDPDTVLAPDVAFLRLERLPTERTQGFMEGVPDLAVEIVSPNDRHVEVQRKALAYLRWGVSQVWVVEPESRTVSVYSQGPRVTLLQESDTIEGGDLIPGFSCNVADLFE